MRDQHQYPIQQTQILRQVVPAVLWLGCAWYLGGSFLTGAFWRVLLAVLFLALPLVGLALYQRMVHKTLRRVKYRPGSLLYRFFSGRLLSLAFALCLGFSAGVFLLVRLHVLQWQEWLLMLLAIPVFQLFYREFARVLYSQYRPWLVTVYALRWARIITPTMLAVCYIALALQFRPDGQQAIAGQDASGLNAAIVFAQSQVADLQGSAALQLVAEQLMVVEGMKHYALYTPASLDGKLMLLAAGVETWLLFYLACTVFSAFMLPWSEWRRLFVPLTEATEPPPLLKRELALASAVASFILLFIMLPLVSWLEMLVQQQQPMTAAPSALVLKLERIGADWYRPGTQQLLSEARQQSLDASGVVLAGMQEQIDSAFSAMEDNIDDYLDWYYSLGGEYTRIAHLLAGNLEQYMADRLLGMLQQGDVFAPVQSALDSALAGNEEASVAYLEKARRILGERRVDPGSNQVEALVQVDLAAMLEAPVHQDLISLQTRLLAGSSGSAIAGIMTGAVATKLGSRMIAKGSFKLAAKALAKLAASKAAGATLGAGAGAATGAAMGSIVPGVGTAIGAVIGGVVGGLAVGIGIDKALIEFEEAVNRDEFRAELLATVEEVHNEFRQP